jgi:hypothetical protein
MSETYLRSCRWIAVPSNVQKSSCAVACYVFNCMSDNFNLLPSKRKRIQSRARLSGITSVKLLHTINLKGREHLGDLDVNGRIILKIQS